MELVFIWVTDLLDEFILKCMYFLLRIVKKKSDFIDAEVWTN